MRDVGGTGLSVFDSLGGEVIEHLGECAGLSHEMTVMADNIYSREISFSFRGDSWWDVTIIPRTRA